MKLLLGDKKNYFKNIDEYVLKKIEKYNYVMK